MNDTQYEPPVPDSIYMLVEAQFPVESAEEGSSGSSREQFMGFTDYSNTLFVEEFGQPLAWRVDSHFAFLLRTDKERLLQFIVGSFIAGNLSINNDLQLLRIQSKFPSEVSAADTHPSPSLFQPWTWKEKPNRSSPSVNTRRRMCSLSSPGSLAIHSCARSIWVSWMVSATWRTRRMSLMRRRHVRESLIWLRPTVYPPISHHHQHNR